MKRRLADAGRSGEAQNGGLAGVASHQVVERLVLLPLAAQVFPVEGPPQQSRRGEPLLRPPPRRSLDHFDPHGRGGRLGVGRMQTQDAVAVPRERVPDGVGQRAEPRRSQDLRHGDVAPGRVEPGGIVGVGDDGDRGGVAGLHPAARQELAKWRRAAARAPGPPPRRCGPESLHG